jgi:hypothetical protein
MTKLRRSLATILLLFAMTSAVFADGQSDMGKTPPTGGEIERPPADPLAENVMVDMLTEYALDIWQLIPSLS